MDGSFPGYAEQLQQYSEKKLDLNPNRFRDNLDLLKYSIRSLDRHASWLRRLYIVTTRPQVPAWLDLDAPGVRVVHHDEFMDPACLPTFNSLAIISSLYRIADVGRRFVFIEDDKLLTRDVALDDLMTPDGRARLWLRFTLEDNAWRHASPRLSLWASILARSNRLLNQTYGFRLHGALHDAPLVIDKTAFAAMVAQWHEAFAATIGSRFRTFGNVAPEHIYPHYLIDEGRAEVVPKRRVYREATYMGLDNSRLLTRLRLATLRWKRPKFVCMNDNYGDDPDPRCVALVRDQLEALFPEPSRFERR